MSNSPKSSVSKRIGAKRVQGSEYSFEDVDIRYSPSGGGMTDAYVHTPERVVVAEAPIGQYHQAGGARPPEEPTVVWYKEFLLKGEYIECRN